MTTEPIEVRPARVDDAAELAELLNEIIEIGGTTAFMTPFDAEGITSHFIDSELGVSCIVAEAAEQIVGFQAVEWCDPRYDGPAPLPSDWTQISSFVRNGHGRKGIGHLLFLATLELVRDAGVTVINATIRADNVSGLGYYSSIGFVDYHRLVDVPLANGVTVDRIRKRFDVG